MCLIYQARGVLLKSFEIRLLKSTDTFKFLNVLLTYLKIWDTLGAVIIKKKKKNNNNNNNNNNINNNNNNKDINTRAGVNALINPVLRLCV